MVTAPLVPARRARRVPGRKEGLDRVHVGVHPAVGVECGPRAVPLVRTQAGRGFPEVGVEHGEGVLEQLTRALEPCHHGSGSGQHHERVCIGALGRVGRAVRCERGKPATVLVVVQRGAQRRESAIGDRAAPRYPEQVPERVDMRRAPGDPGEDRTVGSGSPSSSSQAAPRAVGRAPRPKSSSRSVSSCSQSWWLGRSVQVIIVFPPLVRSMAAQPPARAASRGSCRASR